MGTNLIFGTNWGNMRLFNDILVKNDLTHHHLGLKFYKKSGGIICYF